jgi:hypothetical protein
VLPPSTGNGRKRTSLCPLPVIRFKGNLKKNLDTYTDAPEKYI